VAVAPTLVTGLLALPPATAAGSPAAPAEDQAPLALTIDTMSPSVLGGRGPLRISGTVTNTSDEPWAAVNVYPFTSFNDVDPTVITTTEQLESEMDRGPEEYVGGRYTGLDNFESIRRLDPGQTADYTATITADQLEDATQEGVYWVGVHALGESASTPRDGYADGRARTFVPLVGDDADPVDAALVLPLRHRVRHTPDGRVDDVEGWGADLAPGGRLADTLAFARRGGDRVTWLVDPAVVDTVGQLADDNPPRSLASTLAPPDDDDASPAPSESPSGSEEPTPSADAEGDASSSPASPGEEEADGETDVAEGSAAERRAAGVAADWLDAAEPVLARGELLLLPYGDVDVAALRDRAPGWYARARDRSGSRLAPWGLPGRPVVAPLYGTVDPETLATLPAGTTVLASERSFATDDLPAVAEVGRQQVVVTDRDVARGGPGPDPARSPVALRQQVLAEGALRALGDGRPLVVVVPPSWHPPGEPAAAAAFFDGLDVPWLRPDGVDDVELLPSRPVEADEVRPRGRRNGELPRANITSARELAAAGARMDSLLYLNDTVGREVSDEAFAATSVLAGRQPRRSRTATDLSRQWIVDQMGRVGVRPPPAVLLTSDTGTFTATVVNGLDHPVEVQVKAITDGEVQIPASEVIRLQAGDRTSVPMDASTSVLGQHEAELVLTDAEGRAIGASAEVSVSANQVSNVIWVVIAAGGLLLVSAVVTRLVRRIGRAWRRRRGAAA
jgi:hypothetical protein